MRVVVTIEANTDTELLEALISSYNRIFSEITDVARLRGKLASERAVLRRLQSRGFAQFGGMPSYEIKGEPK